MTHALYPAQARDTIREYGTTFISWGVGIALLLIGFPLSTQLIKQLLLLLYEVFIQYRY